jgi:hypothetical protein
VGRTASSWSSSPRRSSSSWRTRPPSASLFLPPVISTGKIYHLSKELELVTGESVQLSELLYQGAGARLTGPHPPPGEPGRPLRVSSHHWLYQQVRVYSCQSCCIKELELVTQALILLLENQAALCESLPTTGYINW